MISTEYFMNFFDFWLADWLGTLFITIAWAVVGKVSSSDEL